MGKLGRAGGRARAAALTPAERSAAARRAIRARWDKQKALQNGNSDAANHYADIEKQERKRAKKGKPNG